MTIFKFTLKRYFRQPSNIIFLLILPIILVFLPNLVWPPIPMGFQYYGVLLLFISTRLTGIILEDRTRKTTLRISVAPITHFQYLWQNLLAYSVLLMGVNLLVVSIGVLYHGENLISPVLLFVVYTFFSMSAIGFSLAYYAIIRNKEAALTLLTGIISLISMLGGVFWPIEIMPVFIQRLAMLLPTYWYSEGIVRVAFGGSLGDISLPLIMMFMFTVLFLLLGSKRDII
jgi:ABC-2 type transport system permease protein